MKSISSALEALYQASKLHADQVLGKFEKRQLLLSLPALPGIQLSSELAYFYAHYHCDALFSKPGVAFTTLEKLVERQKDFASFSTDQGRTRQPDPTWNPHWVVFADFNDDPIVADTSAPGTPIYAAIEAVNYELLTPSLADFFRVLAKTMEVAASLNSQQPTSDDIEEWISFGAEVEAPTTLAALREVVATQYVEAVRHFFYS